MIKKYFSYLYKNIVKDSRKHFLSLFEHNEKVKLLDCGCWDGANTIKYGELIGTKELYGIEIDKIKAKRSEKRLIKVKVGDLNKKLLFPDKTFDVVVVYHVIEHLVNVKFFVSEIYRVLKNDGYAIIGTPNLASWHNIFALLIGIQPFSGPTIIQNYESDVNMVKNLNKKRMTAVFLDYNSRNLEHIKVMTLRALISLLKSNKFRIESKKGFGYYPLPPLISNLLSKLDPYHSHYIILKVRKK